MKSSPVLRHDKLGFREISYGAIRRWRLLVLAVAGVSFLAVFAWRKIPRAEDPIIDIPVGTVVIPYHGAAPEDVESQVVTTIEPLLAAMDGATEVNSNALPGEARFQVRFTKETPMDVAVEKMRGLVLGARKSLPSEVDEPIVTRLTTSSATQMVVAVEGNRADAVLNEAAKHLRDRLDTIKGVAAIDLVGAREKSVRVRVDPARLSLHGLGVNDVVRALQRANIRSAGGEFVFGSVVTLLRVDNEFKDVAAVRAVQVATSSGPPVTLGDVADVVDGYAPVHERFMQGGLPAVGLEIRFLKDTDATDVGNRLRAEVQREQASMPKGVRCVVAFDQPLYVADSIGSFVESLVEGISLVMLIVTLGMGWRAALVVATALPLCIGCAILGLYALGFSLEQVSIAGLIVALGLLVDDAVVVTESVQLMRDRGISPVRAAVFGTARVFWANNGTTAVACASFLPLFFIGGEVGDFVRGLPTTVLIALVMSLVIAQLFTPWLSMTLLRKSKAGTRDVPDDAPFDREDDVGDEAHTESNPALRVLKVVYERLIPYVLRFPLAVVLIATVALGSSLALLPRIGFQFFPKSDKGLLFVDLDLPRGSSDSRVMERTAAAVAIISKDPDVASTSAVLGGAYPPVFVGRGRKTNNVAMSDILVQLRRGARVGSAAARLRRALADIPAVDCKVEELYKGPSVPHPVLIRVTGDSYDDLAQYAEKVKQILRAEPGTLNVNDSLNETVPLTNVTVDTERAAQVGIAPSDVQTTLRQLHGLDQVSSFRKDLDTITLVIDTGDDRTLAFDALEETLVTSPSGAQVPLSTAAAVQLGAGHAELSHRNKYRVVEVFADVDSGTLPAHVMADIRPALTKLKLASGYSLSIAGEEEKTNESLGRLSIAALGTMVIITLLLLLMFDEYKLVLIILAALPFGLIGAVIGLLVAKSPFGFMPFLGIIALLGVYVNHKIYLVDRMRELIHRGTPWHAAIRQAGIDRLRPVVLTALTAVLGLLPLALEGGSLWSGFGWVNICGLVASIPLSLLLVPALIALTHKERPSLAELATSAGAPDRSPNSPPEPVPMPSVRLPAAEPSPAQAHPSPQSAHVDTRVAPVPRHVPSPEPLRSGMALAKKAPAIVFLGFQSSAPTKEAAFDPDDDSPTRVQGPPIAKFHQDLGQS